VYTEGRSRKECVRIALKDYNKAFEKRKEEQKISVGKRGENSSEGKRHNKKLM
jgi:hypothetical protein